MNKLKKIVKDLVKLDITIIYRLMKKLPLKNNRVVLDSWKGKRIRGNIEGIYKEIQGRAKVVPTMSLRHLFYLATARYWIVDTLYYDFLPPRKETKYILVWHAAGIFKKFGLSCNGLNSKEVEIYKRNGERLTHLIVSSPKVKEIYSEALGVAMDKILPIGIPRTDAFIHTAQTEDKANLYKKYGISKNQKVILYAPTFRGEGETAFQMPLDIPRFKAFLGMEYVLLIKLHPNNYILHEEKEQLEKEGKIKIVDEDLEALMKLSDMLITDYSSAIFEYALLDQPIFFYAYDLEAYIADSRGFYQDYRTFIPGPLVDTTQALIQAIKDYDKEAYQDKIKQVADDYQLHDGKCLERFKNYFF